MIRKILEKAEKEKPRLDTFDEGSFSNIFDDSRPQNPNDAVKELFEEIKVKAKTDLSSRQISKISRVYYLADLLAMPELETLMNEFITLRISKDRKSRAEFVEGLKAKLTNMNIGSGQDVRQQFGK